jgi:SAM-dependent methyltransferase
MGYTQRERRRLALQAMVLNPLTSDFLARAGLTSGMKVLDLGCGVGDVALIAARLVGSRGRVTAIDLDGDALNIARARADEEGFSQIQFAQANIAERHGAEPYDAVIGRHILIHAADPLGVLRQAASQIHPQGIVAFQEYDLSSPTPTRPVKPLYDKTFQLVVDLFTRVNVAGIGLGLHQLFLDAGLANVKSRAEFTLDGGRDCPFFEWIAETIRSLAPRLEATGIATAKELELDTLAERLRDEAVAIGGCVPSPVLVGTFGQKP